MLALTCLHHIMIPNGTIASSSIPICCFVLLHYILFFDVIRSTLWSRFVCQSCNHRHFYLVEDYNSTLWWRLGIEDSNSTLPSLRSLTHGPSFLLFFFFLDFQPILFYWLLTFRLKFNPLAILLKQIIRSQMFLITIVYPMVAKWWLSHPPSFSFFQFSFLSF
jgi:hypothetical protein